MNFYCTRSFCNHFLHNTGKSRLCSCAQMWNNSWWLWGEVSMVGEGYFEVLQRNSSQVLSPADWDRGFLWWPRWWLGSHYWQDYGIVCTKLHWNDMIPPLIHNLPPHVWFVCCRSLCTNSIEVFGTTVYPYNTKKLGESVPYILHVVPVSFIYLYIVAGTKFAPAPHISVF